MTSLRNLKALRTARGWTQQQLAEESGVKVDAIRKQEQGAVEDTLLSIAHPLAQALDVPIEGLFLPASSHKTLSSTLEASV
ncbi:helix-turn-helix domain-containing protein [Deinococcus sp. SM5_A1]|uniref:helix-turn-helix domain-containing protein n=1 Tax=Deinococcus sp. SM5_A1 TaxID=3379094 RepID=UPI00385AF2B1